MQYLSILLSENHIIALADAKNWIFNCNCYATRLHQPLKAIIKLEIENTYSRKVNAFSLISAKNIIDIFRKIGGSLFWKEYFIWKYNLKNINMCCLDRVQVIYCCILWFLWTIAVFWPKDIDDRETICCWEQKVPTSHVNLVFQAVYAIHTSLFMCSCLT